LQKICGEDLQKICGEEISKRIIGGCPKVKEEEVEVINLQLNQNERLALHGECASYFEKGAWIAAGHNLTHSECVSGIVLTVYTEAEDKQFWLFYCIEKPRKVAKMSASAKLRGYC
jgi:hypothetical protein